MPFDSFPFWQWSQRQRKSLITTANLATVSFSRQKQWKFYFPYGSYRVRTHFTVIECGSLIIDRNKCDKSRIYRSRKLCESLKLTFLVADRIFIYGAQLKGSYSNFLWTTNYKKHSHELTSHIRISCMNLLCNSKRWQCWIKNTLRIQFPHHTGIVVYFHLSCYRYSNVNRVDMGFNRGLLSFINMYVCARGTSGRVYDGIYS